MDDIGGSKASLSEAVDVSDPARVAFFSVPSGPVPFVKGITWEELCRQKRSIINVKLFIFYTLYSFCIP